MAFLFVLCYSYHIQSVICDHVANSKFFKCSCYCFYFDLMFENTGRSLSVILRDFFYIRQKITYLLIYQRYLERISKTWLRVNLNKAF